MILLTTDRLIIRSFHESDLDDLFCLLSNEEVMKYIEPPYNKEETKDFLYKYGLIKEPKIYAVTYQNIFIGYVIYHPYEDDSMEIGWIINKEYWNRGFASELTDALIKEAFKSHEMVVIECDYNHAASIKIANKYHFSLMKVEDNLNVYCLRKNK